MIYRLLSKHDEEFEVAIKKYFSVPNLQLTKWVVLVENEKGELFNWVKGFTKDEIKYGLMLDCSQEDE